MKTFIGTRGHTGKEERICIFYSAFSEFLCTFIKAHIPGTVVSISLEYLNNNSEYKQKKVISAHTDSIEFFKDGEM
jgi:hypothetical protein